MVSQLKAKTKFPINPVASCSAAKHYVLRQEQCVWEVNKQKAPLSLSHRTNQLHCSCDSAHTDDSMSLTHRHSLKPTNTRTDYTMLPWVESCTWVNICILTSDLCDLRDSQESSAGQIWPHGSVSATLQTTTHHFHSSVSELHQNQFVIVLVALNILFIMLQIVCAEVVWLQLNCVISKMLGTCFKFPFSI